MHTTVGSHYGKVPAALRPWGRGRPSREMLEARERALLAQYLKAREAFVRKVEEQRNMLLAVEDGRRFDKVVFKGHAVFFIERSTGTIYGVKSDIAPNFRHWFDTVYTASKWNWAAEGKEGDFWPEPRKMDGYVEVKGYGNYRHFRAKRGPGRPRKVA